MSHNPGIKRAVLIGLVAVVGGIAVAHSGSATAPRLEPARFIPSDGWHVRTGVVHACPGVSRSRCIQVTSVASTLQFRDCLECLPHRTVAAMRAADVSIQIGLAVEHPRRAGHTCDWPARVMRQRVTGPFEGLPTRIGGFLCQTQVGTRDVSVFILFGRSKPTKRQLQRVNAELRRARL